MTKGLCHLVAGFAIAMSVGSAQACDADGITGFMPENNMYIGVGDKNANAITEQAFNAVIDRVEKVYGPMARAQGGTLKINRLWSDGTVNASATRFLSSWQVNMYGGLARHAVVTEDAFALVLCHEIGHHMGGAPKVPGFLRGWASNEGQSDYFSTTKCFRLAYSQADNAAVIANMKVPASVEEKCEGVWPNESEKALCVRMAMGGLSLAKLLGELGNTPNVDFDTPDTSSVTKTFDGHPKAQCRLDTYLQGSLCDRPMNEAPSNRDAATGYCTLARGTSVGTRPLCWYKP